MRAVHHAAIISADIDNSLRFWRDGLGLVEFMDQTFTGDWPTLFGSDTNQLRSIFLGDPHHSDAGIVELVQFVGGDEEITDDSDSPAHPNRPGFFLLSLNRDIEETLGTLALLGFTDGVRRISMPGPGGMQVAMAVITGPDGVLVELIGAPA